MSARSPDGGGSDGHGPAENPASARAPVWVFAWLLVGGFGWWLQDRMAAPVLQVVLKQLDVSNFTAGLLLGSMPAIVTVLVVPAVSYRSDRHRGRRGRRIPFLAVLAGAIAVAMVGLGCAGAIGREVHRLLGAASPGLDEATIAVCGVFWCLFKLASLPAIVLLHALINDVVPRAFLGRFYGAFRATSLGAGILFNYTLIGYAETHAMGLFTGVGLLFLICFLAMCGNVRESAYPVGTDADPRSAGWRESIRVYCRECFGHRYYAWAIAAINLSWLAFIPVTLFSVFFAKHVGMSMATYGKCVALQYLISLALALPLGWLADRFHPLRVGLVAISLYAVAAAWGAVAAVDASSFAVALVIQGVLCGAWITASASLAQRVFPRERFAQFVSAKDVVLGLSSVLLSAGVGRFLDIMEHDYRYSFAISSVLAVLAAGAGLALYLEFVRLGRPEGGVGVAGEREPPATAPR